MIMEIHSSLGVLKCRELEKQAIENSIPEGQVQEQNKDTQATADETRSRCPPRQSATTDRLSPVYSAPSGAA